MHTINFIFSAIMFSASTISSVQVDSILNKEESHEHFNKIMGNESKINLSLF